MREGFINKKIGEDKKVMIARADKILTEYQTRGFVLTLRQLYYQFVGARTVRERHQELQEARRCRERRPHDGAPRLGSA